MAKPWVRVHPSQPRAQAGPALRKLEGSTLALPIPTVFLQNSGEWIVFLSLLCRHESLIDSEPSQFACPHQQRLRC